ncbi:MAG: spermidine synthase [Opitutales bacterium]
MFAYQLAAFLAAYLLFQVQPMVTKALLPAFGGTFQVWGAAVVFFQLTLFGGYLYAHYVQRWLGARRYARWHLIWLVLPLALLPFDMAGLSAPGRGLPLVLQVLVQLLVYVGLPFFTLSCASLLLQRWLADSSLPERTNPYPLYAASNVGSIAGLLSYPLLIEPWLSLQAQAVLWWVVFVAMVLAHLRCLPPRKSPDEAAPAEVRGEPASASEETSAEATVRNRPWLWFGLSVSSNALLLAATNVLTLKIAALPFLWVLPLTLFLLTFVLTFKRRWFFPAWSRRYFGAFVVLGFALFTIDAFQMAIPVVPLIGLHLAIVFLLCLNCHGELVRLRPAHKDGLTLFYVMLSAGGVVGGLLVAWVLPVLSTTIVEYALAVGLTAATVLVARRAHGQRWFPERARWVRALGVPAVVTLLAAVGLALIANLGGGEAFRWMTVGWLATCLAVTGLVLPRSPHTGVALSRVAMALALVLLTESVSTAGRVRMRHRNYYGAYTVVERGDKTILEHGRTVHGKQFTEGPRRRVPLSYYHPRTPFGGWLYRHRDEIDEAAMIGLGTGALAVYFEKGQRFDVYELDPDNEWIAREYFSYLDDADKRGLEVRFFFGDGRLRLSEAPSDSLDLLVVDAFSGDSIPVHLLTVEAFDEYLRVLRPGGMLALHISNNLFDLTPVVYAAAQVHGASAVRGEGPAGADAEADFAQWMLVTRDEAAARRLRQLGWQGPPVSQQLVPWSDDFSNPLSALIW